MTRRNYWGGNHVGSHDQAMLVAFEDMREAQASAEFSALAATITRQAIFAACEAFNGAGSASLPQFAPVADVAGERMVALRLTLNALYQRLKAGVGGLDLIFPLLEEVFAYQLISAWPRLDASADPSPVSPPNRSIRRSIDYIEANLSRKLTIAEIAAVAGVGIRTLQLAFRQQVGCTPVEYLINRRLDRVREALQTSDGTMTIRQIATQMGFVHMSDFSRRYRQRYGHPPKLSRP